MGPFFQLSLVKNSSESIIKVAVLRDSILF